MQNTVERKNKSKLYKILKIALIFMLVAFVVVGLYVIILSSTLKLNDEMLDSLTTPVSIYDKENTLVNFGVDSPYVSVDELNQHTIDAFISIEDEKFYTHKGINIGRMAKALVNNISSGSIVEGASTISQQLIKNTHLDNEKTYSRKIREILLTLKLEQKYSKDEIMEMYLNAIYFGSGCYGLESASIFYFGKNAKDLTINESAILAGIIKSPSYLSPINYPSECLERKNLVLKQMLVNEKITKEQYETSIAEGIELNLTNPKHEITYSEYITSAISEASEILQISKNSIASNNYKIYTYLDNNAQNSLSKNIETSDSSIMHNGILIDNETGGINAFCSNLQFGGISVKRTPASTLKPILVYAPAIEKGNIYFDSIIKDEPTNFGDYSPHNINNKYYGDITASSALALSLNIPAVKILEQIGIDQAKEFASTLGIPFDENDNGLALALGGMTKGISILELCNAYSPFVNNGSYKEATFIRKITDQDGKILYMHNPTSKKVMKDSTAYLIGEMMRKTVTEGTCKALKGLDFEVRAKSGTNGTADESLNTDMLCVAQTTKHTSCIWYYAKDNGKENLIKTSLGNDISPTLKIKSLFEEYYTSTPKDFVKPNSVVELKLDRLSYEKGVFEIATANTPERYTITSIFDITNKPKAISTNFSKVQSTKLTAIKGDSSVKLKFDVINYQNYKLIRKQYKNNRLINTSTLLEIKEKDDFIEYIDEDIESNSKYVYMLEIEQKSGLKENSNQVTVFFNAPPRENKNIDSYRWYF